MDLKSQLKFLGVENVDDMFRVFLSERNRNSFSLRDASSLLFFLRNIMMRHTHKQKYRDTSTTLMSLPAKVGSHLVFFFFLPDEAIDV